jgi:hypothetical protein
MLKVEGRTTVSEFVGDRIVYRTLAPADPRLPALAEFGAEVGLQTGLIPRKNDPEYARAIVYLLKAARRLDAPGAQLQRLIYLGDTRLADGTAFDNLCRAGGWPGAAFIGSENGRPPNVELSALSEESHLYQANRWAALANPEMAGKEQVTFERFCELLGLRIDEGTAVVLDLDKTAVGARGRNAHPIDQARVQAVRETVADLLGTAFDPQAFQAAYDRLNQPEFHPFTADNQDYLAYICLILGSGLYKLNSVVANVRAGQLISFEEFIEGVAMRREKLAPQLRPIHDQIYTNVRAGDPTPFKEFRRNEYLATVRRMGRPEEEVPISERVEKEILITAEVRNLALKWGGQGALVFALSDKPDEASTPTPELAAQGCQPIHRIETHAVGE